MMQINSVTFQQLEEEHSRVAKEASNIAVEATETLKTMTKEFSETTAQIKAEHKREITGRDRVIKMLVVSLIIVSGAAIYLGMRSLTIKC